MNITFNDPELADLYEGKCVRSKSQANTQMIKQYIKTIQKLYSLEKIEQIYQFNGLHYEKLKGKWKGKSSIRINKQYRLIFKEINSDHEPYELICLSVEQITNHYE